MEEQKAAPSKKRRNRKTKRGALAPAESGFEAEAAQGGSTYEEELEWCVNQVLLGLTKNDVDIEQFKEAKRVITKLLSTKATFVSKRHLMRVCFGDYRKRMRHSTLASTRLEMSKVDKPALESQIGMEIPYTYPVPNVPEPKSLEVVKEDN